MLVEENVPYFVCTRLVITTTDDDKQNTQKPWRRHNIWPSNKLFNDIEVLNEFLFGGK